jgi:predicted HicB family RNase H-like nuclease
MVSPVLDAIYNGPERRYVQVDIAEDRRKPGRPRLAASEASGTLSVRLPAGLHDLACRVALRDGVSVSAVIRAALERMMQDRR